MCVRVCPHILLCLVCVCHPAAFCYHLSCNMCLTSELWLNTLSQLLMSVFPHVMAVHDNSALFVYCAGDEPCSSSSVSQFGPSLYSQRTLWLPGDTCTSTQGEGTLLHSQMRLCNIAVASFLTFHPLRWFHWLEGAGGRQQQPQEESIPRDQCWVSAEVRGN